jgi:hypothetical protein
VAKTGKFHPKVAGGFAAPVRCALLTMDSAVLGLAALDCDCCTVRVFRLKFPLEDAIGSHACSLQANMRVTNDIPLGSSLSYQIGTVNCVATLKAVEDLTGTRAVSVATIAPSVIPA